MYFAKLNVPAQNRVSVQKFLGYDAGMRTADGAFRAMKNLCSDGYPSLTVRPKRGTVGRVTEPHGMLGKDCLLWVDGQTLYMNGVAVNLTLSRTDKQLISMGAYVLIWPDRLYLNTKDITDCGSIENTTTPAGEVSFPPAGQTVRLWGTFPYPIRRRPIRRRVPCGVTANSFGNMTVRPGRKWAAFAPKSRPPASAPVFPSAMAL